MYWGTQKPETRGKNPTFLEPKPDLFGTQTRPEPENQNLSKTRNPTIKTQKPEGFSDFKVLGKITAK